MADENGGYKISDRLLRLSTPRAVKKADGSSEDGLSSTYGSTRPNSPSSKRLTPEQMEKIANRLIAQQRKTKELPPIVKSRRMEKAEEEKSIHRLYNDAMQTQQKKRAMSAERVFKAERCETKVVPHEQIDELVSRLHDRSAEVAKRKHETLEKKYIANASSHSAASTNSSSHRRLKKTEVAEISNRLSNESAAAARSSKASLYEKYVLSRVPKGAPMSLEELADASARLYRNEPRTD